MSELEKIFAKADKAKTEFTFPKINLKINAKLMREGGIGLLLDGKVYPIAKKKTKLISFVRSVRTAKGQKPFAQLLLSLQKNKSESDRKKIYQTFLEETEKIPLNVSEFLYEYSNAKLPSDKKPKTSEPTNLFAPQESLITRIRKFLPTEASARSNDIPEKPEKAEKLEEKKLRGKESKQSKKEKADKKEKKDETPAPQKEAKAKPNPRKLRGRPSEKEQREAVVDAEGDVREERGEEVEGGFLYDGPIEEAEIIAETAEDAREEAEAKRQDGEPMLQREAPPPPEPRPNIQMDIEEKKDDISADRQTELNRSSAEAEGKREEMEKDSEPDISRHGHQIAIQNVFIKNDKDFSFIKKQLARSLYINKTNKSIKQEIDLIYAYYSSLFPLTAKKEYSKENCLELKTLEFQYKRNIQFERSWKKNLATMRMPSMGGAQQQRGQNVGIIVNTEGMGMNAGQFFQQSSQTPSTQAPAPAPLGNPTQTQGSANPQSVMTKPMKESSGGAALSDIKKEKIIPQTQRINPKSSRKREKRVKRQEINLVVRQKIIKPNLLFTNPKVRQRIPEPEGALPLFTFRAKNKNRIKL